MLWKRELDLPSYSTGLSECPKEALLLSGFEFEVSQLGLAV